MMANDNDLICSPPISACIIRQKGLSISNQDVAGVLRAARPGARA